MRTNFQNYQTWEVRKQFKRKPRFNRPRRVDDRLRNNVFVKKFVEVPVTLNPVYADYIKSDNWKAKALLVKKYNNFNCERCNLKYGIGDLQCHHLTYERLGAERFTDLQCLCQWCHQSEHSNN